MVDVGDKQVTDRRAVARAVVRMSPDTAAAVARGDAPKGDVVSTARLAGIQAAKRTAELIPLCHPLPLSFVDVRIQVGEDRVEIAIASGPVRMIAGRMKLQSGGTSTTFTSIARRSASS